MVDIIDIVCHNHASIISKVDYIAGYFNKEKFKEVSFQIEENLEEKMKENNIFFKDFSPYVQELCGNDYSKLSIIILLAYCVEI
ncbi:MAG: hypothetical protein ACI4LX_03270 [Treponema sp.]